MLDRANDLIERAGKLDDAFANLHAFRSLLQDLADRCPLRLPPEHSAAIEMVRAAVLRSAIAQLAAMLDSRRSDRASLGQITEILKDAALIEFIIAKRGGDAAKAAKMRERLENVGRRYNEIFKGEQFNRVQQLRHDEIGHLLLRDDPTPTVEYADIFALADEVEQQIRKLFEGLGLCEPAFLSWKDKLTERSKLFWDTHLHGIGSS